MELSGEHYFDFCHHLFQQREEQSNTSCDHFVRIGDRFTLRIKFAGAHLMAPFVRALAHLSTEPTINPDLTICVWDNPPNFSGLLLYPFGRDSERSKRHTIAGIQVSSDLWPSRVSVFSAERKLGHFWIEDIQLFPWYELCRPLRNIIHWWALTKGLHMVHGACVGTGDGAALIVGHPRAGKSTIALSSLSSELSFASDDLCLVGFEGKQAFAYSLYNTAKLEGFDKLPQLKSCVFNEDRKPREKAFMFVSEHFPDKILKKMPLRAIVVPNISGQPQSHLSPIDHNEAFKTLIASTGEELGGTSATDFFGPFRVCKATPCFALSSGTDLMQLNASLITLLKDQTPCVVPE